MRYVNGVSSLYIRKFKRKLEQYNKPGPLPAYFGPMIGEKKHVRIAEVGAGPINTIGNQWPGVEVEVVASDVLQPEYAKLWAEHGATPIVPIECQDMEHLTYPDESFDVVHAVNCLDHTEHAFTAIEELRRICKKGGWVYLRHAPNQKQRFGGKHYWDVRFEDGKCVFHGNGVVFSLDDFEAKLESEPGREEQLIVAICQK